MKLKEIYVFLNIFLITEKYILVFKRFLKYNKNIIAE